MYLFCSIVIEDFFINKANFYSSLSKTIFFSANEVSFSLDACSYMRIDVSVNICPFHFEHAHVLEDFIIYFVFVLAAGFLLLTD